MKLMCFSSSKPSSSQTNLTTFYKYLATRFSGKTDKDWRKAAEFLLISPTDFKSKEIQAWIKTNLKPFGYKSIHTNQIVWYTVGAVYRPPSSTADTYARLELNIEAAYLRNQEIHVSGDLNMNFSVTACKKHRLAKAFRSSVKFESTRKWSYTSCELYMSRPHLYNASGFHCWYFCAKHWSFGPSTEIRICRRIGH